MTTLRRTLTLGPAIGLAITLVVGSGILVLPGLAYQRSGGAAIYAWVLDALLVAPLLVVFARLGAAFPGAGGVAGFVQAAFSRRAGAGAEMLLLGTFVFGGPAVAVTGGRSFAAAVGGSPAAAATGAAGLLVLALVVNLAGARLSGRVQQALAFTFVGLLAAAAVGALVEGDRSAGAGLAPPGAWREALPSLGMVFSAYVGWEMLSFTAEEYVNPKRDFPLAVAASFAAVLVLYFALAAAVQLILPADDPRLSTAPLAAMLGTVFGAGSETFLAALGVAIVAATLMAGTFASSRLVFASAREGLLPGALARVDPRTGTPRAAVGAAVATFAAVSALEAAGVVSLDALLEVAGRNFLVLYWLGVAAYVRLARGWGATLFGLLTLAGTVAAGATFGLGLLYPAALFAAGAALGGSDASSARPPRPAPAVSR